MILSTRIGKETIMGDRAGVVLLLKVGQQGEGLLQYHCHGLWGVLDHHLAREDHSLVGCGTGSQIRVYWKQPFYITLEIEITFSGRTSNVCRYLYNYKGGVLACSLYHA